MNSKRQTLRVAAPSVLETEKKFVCTLSRFSDDSSANRPEAKEGLLRDYSAALRAADSDMSRENLLR